MIHSIVIASLLGATILTLLNFRNIFCISKAGKAFPLRGVLKYYTKSNDLTEDQKKAIMRWVFGNILASFIFIFWGIYFLHTTDYSFLMILIPTLWVYWLFRAMLWEKSDLLEYKNKKEKNNQ